MTRGILGVGAGFYVDATVEPWSRNYRMYTYVTQELRALVEAQFPADPARTGIFGHSMGGHGALTIALRNPERYRSVSAFAPIAAPKQCPWGQKAFSGYLGPDRGAVERLRRHRARHRRERRGAQAAHPHRQGLSDQFLQTQLHPHLFEEACKKVGYPLQLRRHEGYDHGYYFISTFMQDHLVHHAKILQG